MITIYMQTAPDFNIHHSIIMNKHCYSSAMYTSAITVENSINRLRIQQKLRVLWPDYEVYDLIDAGISVEQLPHFTSNPLIIEKIIKIQEFLTKPLILRSFTHMAVHKINELSEDFQRVDRFYVIFSKRGLAIDQFNSKYVRGNYLISAQVAQIQKQTCFWGVEYISEGRHIISPKNILKCNSLWRLQFQSSKSLKSIMFYSTKREPKYGKYSNYGNQLPKDVKLEFCMKVRIFSSFMESLMNNQEKIFDNVPHFISPKKNHFIFCQSETKQNKKQTEIKMKKEERIIKNVQQSESSLKNKQIRIKILPNSSFLTINKLQMANFTIDIRNVRSFIEIKQKMIHQTAKEAYDTNQSLQNLMLSLSFQSIRHFDWTQLTNLLQSAKKSQQNDLFEYMFAALINNFSQSQERTIDKWMQLYKLLDLFEEEQMRDLMTNWVEQLMIQYCYELLKDCDEELFEILHFKRELIIKSIVLSLEYCFQTSKMSDLLYLLMKFQEKKSIFDLYHSHHLINNPIFIAQSLKKWQISQHLYTKDDADVIYQIENMFQPIFYETNLKSREQLALQNNWDFILTFSIEKFPKNALFSGKQYGIVSNIFKIFLYRNESSVYCFIQKITPLNQEPFQPSFTSYDISTQITMNDKKHSHFIGWSFISPSNSIGFCFPFNESCTFVNISCIISFKRNIVHDSILNYLRIRYEQLLKMHNKCSDKLELQNKKLLKRRSSLFLEKTLVDQVIFCDTIDDQCFLHGVCQKCEALSSQNSIFRLQPLDLYKLMLSAPFKNEMDALLVTIKYLILTPQELKNKYFWLSQLRINHLNLKSLLQLLNKKRLQKDMHKILSSIMDQKMRENIPSQIKIVSPLQFIHRRSSRLGKSMWFIIEEDYSQEYLEFLNNVHEFL